MTVVEGLTVLNQSWSLGSQKCERGDDETSARVLMGL